MFKTLFMVARRDIWNPKIYGTKCKAHEEKSVELNWQTLKKI